MNGVFYIGATGLDAQGRAVDTVANNVANINTPTFKRASVSFAELVASARHREGTDVVAAPVPRGVIAEPVRVDFTQGQLTASGEPMDLAIRGEGFIPLATADADGLTLWRGGRLRINADGALVTEAGQPLEAGIFVPDDARDIAIDADGRVSAVTHDGEALELGQIELVVPADLRALEEIGSGLYRLESGDTAPELLPAGEGRAVTFSQGFVEAANIDLSQELVALMVHQRAYAASARLVQIGDELMALANGLKR